jgi:hypothetical protein
MESPSRWAFALCSIAAMGLLLGGCSGGGGKGGSSTPAAGGQVRSPTLVGGPSGTQAGSITIPYKLFASGFTQVTVRAEYSADGGPFVTATAGSGGDGTSALAATPYGSLVNSR